MQLARGCWRRRDDVLTLLYISLSVLCVSGTDYLGDAGAEMDDDELTRDKVKRASTQILQQIDKRKRKQPKKKDAGEKKKGDPVEKGSPH